MLQLPIYKGLMFICTLGGALNIFEVILQIESLHKLATTASIIFSGKYKLLWDFFIYIIEDGRLEFIYLTGLFQI